MKQVLYLEDNFEQTAVDLAAIQDCLPCRFTLAASVREAERYIAQQSFDVFVLDIEMTNERSTGLQLAQHIRQLPGYAATPMIFTSVHTHFSHLVLSEIRHAAFLPKPLSTDALLREIGVALNIPAYLKQHYHAHVLTVSGGKGTYIEIDPTNVSYMQTSYRTTFIQCIDQPAVEIHNQPGEWKAILEQIRNEHMDYLRQIYRSIIINTRQIQDIIVEKNVAQVKLFGEPEPLPLGMQYRENLREFMK